MKRKNTLFRDTIPQSYLLPSIGKRLLLLSLGIVLITGCNLDLDLDRDMKAEPPVIEKLTLVSPIKVQTSVDVAAVVPRNEDEDLRYEYNWHATAGEIVNNGVWDPPSRPKAHSSNKTNSTKGGKKKVEGKEEVNSTKKSNWAQKIDDVPSVTAMATYIAPKTAGVYTITLKVRTRYAFAEKSINVEVTDDIIASAPFAYWGVNGNERLPYRFKVSAIRRSPILLRYEIQQDSGQPAANLVIKIGKKQVGQKQISNAPPRTDALISGEVDITSRINCPEQYKLTFILKTDGAIMEKAWLLQSVQIFGVEGVFLPY